MKTKICSKCKVEKLATREFFYAGAVKDGLRSECKECSSVQNRKYRLRHREKRNEYHRKYRLRNKEILAEYGRKYREQNRDKIRQLCREWYWKNHKYALERARKYRKEHSQEIRAWTRDYYQRNRAEQIQKTKEWQQKNPEKVKAKKELRYAIEKNARVDGFGRQEFLNWLESQKPFKCYLCGKRIKKEESYEIEHRIPLTRGGRHVGYNLGIACKKCNSSKYNKTPWEFLPEKFRPELIF